ncbi:hypothetical protein B0T10DRAFT_416680 [Thelonectria olida]|uniref:Uncharacterized protein n=1 Tax=Thelonectria olida TaxID=1576542 RepID=A0A9P8VUA3_9HYPO|nr:hypothetical protein B0T10DRAFT_416680 [Thelonectria olida]
MDRERTKPARYRTKQCWDHGCNGREFSTRSNFLRHCRDRSKKPKMPGPDCDTKFTRLTAP